MVIVDSSVWIDYLGGVTNPETEWLDLGLSRERFALTTLIMAEVLQGVRDDRDAAAVQAALMEFDIIELHEVGLAVDAAQNYRRLRKAGYTVRKTVDGLIATYCIRSGYSLLHRDRDFDAFEKHLGLRVVAV